MKLFQVFLKITLLSYLLSKENKAKCGDFFSFDQTAQTCQLRDIIHNKKYLMKYYLNELKNSSSDTCERNSKSCSNHLIGPVIHKDLSDEANSLFFISLSEKKQFSLTDYSYKVSNDTQLSGYIFALFPYKETDMEDVTPSNSSIIYNIKQFRNLGSKLKEVKILPGMHYQDLPIQNGIIFKYDNGDACLGDKNKKNSAYIIINCDITGFYLTPQLKFISEDKCTFVFEWNNKFGCPNCLKKDLIPIYQGCFNGVKRAHYSENLNCVIPKENTSSSLNSTPPLEEYSNDDNILHYDNTDSILLTYLMNKYDLTKERLRKDFSLANITTHPSIINQSNGDIYVERKIQHIPCSKKERLASLNYAEEFIVIAIGIAYAVLILCLIYLFCQYKRVSKEYTRLKQNDTHNTIDNFPNNAIELTNI